MSEEVTQTKPRRGRPPRNKPAESVVPEGFTLVGTPILPTAPEPEREPIRQPLRDEDPRAAAAARAASIWDQVADVADGVDEFFFDPRDIPDGWTYEWKRDKVMNAEDPAYKVQLQRTGWEPVPAGRHPQMMPAGYKGFTIERKGMILMQRPKVITDHFRERDNRNARGQVLAKEQQLSAAPAGQFERNAPKVKTGDYRPVDIPADTVA